MRPFAQGHTARKEWSQNGRLRNVGGDVQVESSFLPHSGRVTVWHFREVNLAMGLIAKIEEVDAGGNAARNTEVLQKRCRSKQQNLAFTVAQGKGAVDDPGSRLQRGKEGEKFLRAY